MGLFDRLERFLDDVLLLPEDLRESLDAGDAALEADLPKEAAEFYGEVLAARPSLLRAALGLAEARRRLGDRGGALEALRHARALAPEDGELALATAESAASLAEWAIAGSAARVAARAFAAREPARFVEAQRLGAQADRELGRPDRAARELRKALAMEESLSPADLRELRLELLDALADDGDHAALRQVAGRLEIEELAPGVAGKVGDLLAEGGFTDEAAAALSRAAAHGHVRSKIGLARLQRLAGQVDQALETAQTAVAQGGGVDALDELALVFVASGRDDEAFEAMSAAAQAAPSVGRWRACVRTAPLVDLEAMSAAMNGLLGISPDDALTLLARAGLLVAEARACADPREFGEVLDATASALAHTFPPGAGEPRAMLLLAEARLLRAGEGGAAGEEHIGAALEALDRYADEIGEIPRLGSDDARAASLRSRALEVRFGAGESLDLAAALDDLTEFAKARDRVGLERAARRVRDDIDRPLLLAVLGEFNAGKSTLINAFIGAKVAPMGIVPTTATLNVLRSGAERRVRVVRGDGSTREGDYASLERLLADAEEGEGVDRVEIILPSETLERVWILDAPGTNAIDARHTQLAKEAARRADAVLWVFDAAQAGKMTEGAMHKELQRQGRHATLVLNKRDRLKPGELEKVSAVVSEGFGASPVAVSARAALKAKIAGDENALAASSFPELMETLERDVFARSRSLKRRAVAGRLADLLDDLLAEEESTRDALSVRALEIELQREQLAKLPDALEIAVHDAVRLLERDLDAAFGRAAQEVLEFVRPRSSRFAQHGVDREDRAFLEELLEEQMDQAVAACERRLRAQVAGLLRKALDDAPGAGGSEEPRWRDARAWIDDALLEQHLGRSLEAFRGFQRGLLAGTLPRFFAEVLPRAALDAEKLQTALSVGRADGREELREPLAAAVAGLLSELISRLDAAHTDTERDLRRLGERVFGPWRVLGRLARELALSPVPPAQD